MMHSVLLDRNLHNVCSHEEENILRKKCFSGVFRSFLCFFGIHHWLTEPFSPGSERICGFCARRQSLCYDMAYGCSYWE